MNSSFSPARNHQKYPRTYRMKAKGLRTEFYEPHNTENTAISAENLSIVCPRKHTRSFEGGVRSTKGYKRKPKSNNFMVKSGYNHHNFYADDEIAQTTIEKSQSYDSRDTTNFKRVIEIKPKNEILGLKEKYEDFELNQKACDFLQHRRSRVALKCILALNNHKEEKKRKKDLLNKGFLFFKFRLVNKSFFAWKRTIKYRVSVKNFLVRRLTRKKISSKLLIFSILKRNYENVKNVEKNYSKAVGFHTLGLLKKSLRGWKLFAKGKKILKKKEKILVEGQSTKLKKISFFIWFEALRQSIDLKNRERELKEYITLKRRRAAFHAFIDKAEDYQIERNLEKRSNYFFSYWGAREFFKRAFAYVEIKKEQRLKQELADTHYQQMMIKKCFYSLVNGYYQTRMVNEHVDMLYFNKLQAKAFNSLQLHSSNQLSKIPLYSPRQIYLTHKFISILDFDQTVLEENRNNFLTNRMMRSSRVSQNSRITKKSYELGTGQILGDSTSRGEDFSQTHRENPFVNIENVIQEEEFDFEGEEEYSSNMYERTILEINSIEEDPDEVFNTTSGESEVVNSISRIDAILPKSERFYKQEQYEMQYTVPFYTERIRPKYYFRSNDILEYVYKEKYFTALKFFVQRKKNFVNKKKLTVARNIFEALKSNCYENQNDRYLEEKAEAFYRGEKVRNIFNFMKFYLQKKKKLRLLEEEYMHRKTLEVKSGVLGRMVEEYHNRKIEEYHQELSEKFHKLYTLKKFLNTWVDGHLKQKKLDEKYMILSKKINKKILTQFLEKWRVVLPMKLEDRRNNWIVQKFRTRTLMEKSYFALQVNFEKTRNERMIVKQFRKRSEKKNLEKNFGILKKFAKKSKIERKKREICDEIYARNLTSKSLICLYEYNSFKKQKRKYEEEKQILIKRNSKKIFLKKWHETLFIKIRKRQFFIQMDRLVKKVALRRIKKLKITEKDKIRRFWDKRPTIMLSVFFKALKLNKNYNKKCKENFQKIKIGNQDRLQSQFFGQWRGLYEEEKRKYRCFVKAILYKRKEYLVLKLKITRLNRSDASLHGKEGSRLKNYLKNSEQK